MTKCTETDGANTYETTFGYDRSGNVVRRAVPDGSSTKTTRDILGRTKIVETKAPLTASTSYIPQKFVFSYDLVGNVRTIIETYDGTGSVTNDRIITNTYDRVYRLDIENAGAVVTNYDYDKGNNRIKKTVGSQTTDYFYQTINTSWGITATLNKTNRISHYDVKNSGTLASRVMFRYNNNGNRIAARAENGTGVVQGTNSYTFDREDRLAVLGNGIAPNTGTYTYTYDYRTRRVKKQEPSRTVTSVFSGGTSVQEYEGTTLKAEYVRGSDWGGGVGGILYSVRPTIGRVNYHYNGRGDVTTKTKKNGNAADIDYQASYEAYGTRTQQSGTDADPQKANTKDEDPTGLLNEGFRYRDLITGSFITRDPAGFVDGPNLYTYVKQNPWSSFDPEGLYQTMPSARIHDCSIDTTSSEFQAGFNQGARQVFNMAVDAVPVAGTVKGATEVVTGVNPATGSKLSKGERVASAVGTLAGLIPFGKLASKALSKPLVKNGTAIADTAQTTIAATEATVETTTDAARTSVSPGELVSRQGPSEMTGSKVKRFTKEMKENGYGEFPPVEYSTVDGRKIIVDGHHRAEAARKAQVKKIPAVEKSVTPADADRYSVEAAEAAQERASKKQ